MYNALVRRPPVPHRIARPLMLIALWLAIGAAINFGVCWWCARQYQVGYDAAEARVKAMGWQFETRRQYGQAPLTNRQFRNATPPYLPPDWPQNEWFLTEKDYGSLVSRYYRAAEFPSGAIIERDAMFYETGWPMRCCWSANFYTNRVYTRRVPKETGGPFQQRTSAGTLAVPIAWQARLGALWLPYGIRLWPFAANMALYAGALCSLWVAPGAVRAVRRWHRRRAGRCDECGYDMAGVPMAVGGAACPECGRAPAARADRL